MSEEYIKGAHASGARQDQTEHSLHMQHSVEAPAPTIASSERPTFVGSLLNDSCISGRGNAPVRQAAMQSMQRTHGNRAVQRTHSTHNVSQRAAVQRTPTETLATMQEIMGKDNPGFDYIRKQMGMESGQAMHSLETMRKSGMEGPALDWMARQMGMHGVKEKSSGPYANAGQNDAGGYGFEAGLARDEQYLEGVKQDVAYAEGAVGALPEDGGGTQYGIKGGAGVYRAKGQNGGVQVATGGGELSFGENGIRAQAGVSMGGYEGTLGEIDKKSKNDEVLRVGLDVGLSGGARLHWGDTDGDGKREYGFGVDIGPLSADIKTEDPVRTFARPALGPGASLFPDENLTDAVGKLGADFYGYDLGPSEEEQKKNQANFIAKRDKELAEIEKNKDKIMKEQGPQAYYHMTTVANLPPQLRNLVDAASNTGPQ